MLCGAVAGVVWNLTSTAALAIVAPGFAPALKEGAAHPALDGGFFYGIDIAMGIWAVWLYSVLLPTYGARAGTVAIAGVAWWILKTLQSAKWAGLGFVELGAGLVVLGVTSLAGAMFATATGAWLYRKVSESV